MLWMILMGGSLILAAFLMWDLGAGYAPMVAGVLIAIVLANSEVLMIIGNAAANCYRPVPCGRLVLSQTAIRSSWCLVPCTQSRIQTA